MIKQYHHPLVPGWVAAGKFPDADEVGLNHLSKQWSVLSSRSGTVEARVTKAGNLLTDSWSGDASRAAESQIRTVRQWIDSISAGAEKMSTGTATAAEYVTHTKRAINNILRALAITTKKALLAGLANPLEIPRLTTEVIKAQAWARAQICRYHDALVSMLGSIPFGVTINPDVRGFVAGAAAGAGSGAAGAGSGLSSVISAGVITYVKKPATQLPNGDPIPVTAKLKDDGTYVLENGTEIPPVSVPVTSGTQASGVMTGTDPTSVRTDTLQPMGTAPGTPGTTLPWTLGGLATVKNADSISTEKDVAADTNAVAVEAAEEKIATEERLVPQGLDEKIRDGEILGPVTEAQTQEIRDHIASGTGEAQKGSDGVAAARQDLKTGAPQVETASLPEPMRNEPTGYDATPETPKPSPPSGGGATGDPSGGGSGSGSSGSSGSQTSIPAAPAPSGDSGGNVFGSEPDKSGTSTGALGDSGGTTGGTGGSTGTGGTTGMGGGSVGGGTPSGSGGGSGAGSGGGGGADSPLASPPPSTGTGAAGVSAPLAPMPVSSMPAGGIPSGGFGGGFGGGGMPGSSYGSTSLLGGGGGFGAPSAAPSMGVGGLGAPAPAAPPPAPAPSGIPAAPAGIPAAPAGAPAASGGAMVPGQAPAGQPGSGIPGAPGGPGGPAQASTAAPTAAGPAAAVAAPGAVLGPQSGSQPGQPGSPPAGAGANTGSSGAGPAARGADPGTGSAETALTLAAVIATLGLAGTAAVHFSYLWQDLGANRLVAPKPGSLLPTQFGPQDEPTAVLPPGLSATYQKVLLPGEADALLDGQITTVRGLVHPLHQVSHLRTPAELFTALGLGFPIHGRAGADSLAFSRDAASIEVLRFAGLRMQDLITPVDPDVTLPADTVPLPLVRRHARPWTGTGEAPGSTSTEPIDEHEILGYAAVAMPHLAEIWRLHADGSAEHVSTYNARSASWVGSAALPRTNASARIDNGAFATLSDGNVFEAVPLTDRFTLLVARGAAPDGFQPAHDGTARIQVANEHIVSITGLTTVGLWQSLPVQLLERSGTSVLIDYAGDDVASAARAGFLQINQGQWQPRWVDAAEITNVQTLERAYP